MPTREMREDISSNFAWNLNGTSYRLIKLIESESEVEDDE